MGDGAGGSRGPAPAGGTHPARSTGAWTIRASVPRREQRRILGTLFSSSLFEGRAPKGHVLLTTFTGGRRNPEMTTLPDGDLSRTVAGEARSLLGAGTPLWSEVVRWPLAIPQYTLGHLARVAAIDAAAASMPGLHFCANWRGGVSFGDCVRNGLDMGTSIATSRAGSTQPA